MASEDDLPEGSTSSRADSTGQESQAASLNAPEDQRCPLCSGTIKDPAHVGWCRHFFCFLCILEESRRRAVCPTCQWPFDVIYRTVGPNNYETYHLTDYSSYTRSQLHNGHQTVQPAQDDEPSSSTRQEQGRAQETAHEQARASRSEQESPASSGRTQHRYRRRRVSFMEYSSTGSGFQRMSHSAQHIRQWEEQRRSNDSGEGLALIQQRNILASSGRRQRHQRGRRISFTEDEATRSRSHHRSYSARRQTQRERRGSSREPRATRRRSPHRSPSTRHRTQQELQGSSREPRATRRRSRRRSPSTRHRTQQERRGSSRELRATRRRSPYRSPSTRHQTQQERRGSFRKLRATRRRSQHRSPNTQHRRQQGCCGSLREPRATRRRSRHRSPSTRHRRQRGHHGSFGKLRATRRRSRHRSRNARC